MHGRYPEDSNIIDFIYIKLMQLAEFYATSGKLELADACYNALDMYLAGTVRVYFRNGEPYISSITGDEGDAFYDMPE